MVPGISAVAVTEVSSRIIAIVTRYHMQVVPVGNDLAGAIVVMIAQVTRVRGMTRVMGAIRCHISISGRPAI